MATEAVLRLARSLASRDSQFGTSSDDLTLPYPTAGATGSKRRPTTIGPTLAGQWEVSASAKSSRFWSSS